jgi:hypothetical protein
MRDIQTRVATALVAAAVLAGGASRLALHAQSAGPSGKLVIHITTNAVGFGSVRIGQSSAPQTITLQNVGTAPMSVAGAVVGGLHAADFSLVSTCAALPVNATCTMTAAFTPSAQGPRSAMLEITASTPTAPYMLPLVGNGLDPNVPQPSVGPTDPRTGFPTYFSDGFNTLELCLDATPPNDAAGNPQPQAVGAEGLLTPTMCLTPVPDATRPPAITDAPETTNIFDEHFWWSAEAQVTPAGWERARLVLAQEAAFAAQPLAGQQWAFGRLRLRADGVPPGTYVFTHPFGADTVTVAEGEDRVFESFDIGCFSTPCDFTQALPGRTRITRFLQCVNAPIVVNGVEYLGDPGIECPVTGSPLNQNFFRVDRVEANGSRTLLAQTNLFSVSGKRVSTIAPPPPTNQAPDAVDDAVSTPFNTPVTIAVLGNDSDPNLPNDTLHVTTVSQGAGGAVAINASGTVTYTPGSTFSGVDTFSYGISDAAGLADSATVTVTVAPAPPANRNPIAANDSAVTNIDTAVTIAVLANDSDPDGDALSISGVSNVVNGTAVVLAGGTSVRFTPAAGVSGAGSFTYAVSDGLGGTASASVTVAIVNRAPVAGADAATTTQDVAVTLPNLLANDSDPDGDGLTITGVAPGTGGSVSLGGANAVTFTPAAGFVGGATFSYTVSDTRGASATGNVAVSVTSTAPPAPVAGLVLALNFDEASGTTVLDRSGLATPNNGTMNAGVTRVAGRSAAAGSALSFNGTTGMVSIADAASLDLTTGVTIEAWVRSAGGPADWRSLILKERGTATNPGLTYALYANDPTRQNRPAGFFRLQGVDQEVASTTSLPLNTWTHVAVSYDGGAMRFFVNGVQVSLVAMTGNLTASNNPLRIGGNSLWGEFFAGQVDDVRIYNRALTAGEILADMNSPVQ